MKIPKTRICYKCNKRKRIKFFYKNKEYGRAFECIKCNNQFTKDHYKKNKAKYKKRAALRTEKQKQRIRKLKTKPCKDCGRKYHYSVMDFDHVRGVKAFNVGAKGHQVSSKRLDLELKKCDIVCSNCHRLRTFKRLSKLPL